MGCRLHVIPLFALGALLTACRSERSLAPRSDQPRFSLSPTAGLKGRIVFHSTRNGDFDVYIMNADGSRPTQLTNTPDNDIDPVWSPNGKQIAFNRFNDTFSTLEILVMNADGSGVTHIADNAFATAWSPDGKRIAFASNRNGGDEVFFMNADGSGVTQLTSNDFVRDFPTAWSPDGKQILFQSDRDGNTELYVMNVDGTGVTRLTNNPASDEGDHAGWSPDGTRILFSSTRDGGLLHIFAMNPDGSGVTQLTSGAFVDDDPVWSPDGQQIAFHSTRDGGDEDIFVVNADGTGVTQLTFNDGIFDAVPVWTGGHIATPTTQVHFIANGDFASANWVEFDPTVGFVFGFLSVSRGGPTTDPQTFLSYLVFQCDPFFSCNAIRDGSGLIPNSDLSGGRTVLNLRTNTTGNPSFVIFAGPTGLVSMDWRANGLFTQSSSGTNQFTFPGVTHRSQGSFTSASANATGRIVGLPTSPNGSGDIGTSHQTTIDIIYRNAGGISDTLLRAGGTGQTLTNVSGAPLSTAGIAANGATQVHFVANGDFASVNWVEFDPTVGFVFGSLSVNRGGPTNNPQTSLSYSVFQCDPFFSCSAVRDGAGLIPNRDLSGSANSLSLRTNTTGNPNFVTFAGPAGPVSVNWRANGLFTQSSSGTNQFSFSGFTHRSQGNFTAASANAAGSIVGLPISPNGSADVGTNHQVIIDISH